MIIDGKKMAQEIIDELKKLPRPNKTLAAVFVGNDSASESFLRQKERIAKELGVDFKLYRFDEAIEEYDLIKAIKKIGDDQAIGGIIIQLPLPSKFDRDNILKAINSEKDIDALTSRSSVTPLPLLVVIDVLRYAIQFRKVGSPEITGQYLGDPTPKILKYLEDKVVAVVGRGILVGKPIAEWLKGKCRQVIILHRGSDFSQLKSADLVVTGVGKAGLIKSEMLKPGAGVIDFGFDMVDGKIRGDLETEKLINSSTHQLSFYTPTPGGTGPILVAELFRNFYELNQ